MTEKVSFLQRSNSLCKVQHSHALSSLLFCCCCKLNLSTLHQHSLCLPVFACLLPPPVFFSSWCLSLWYLKKVCNLHLLLRTSLGAKQMSFTLKTVTPCGFFFLSHFMWLFRYFTGLYPAPLTSLMESQGHDCCHCSCLKKHCSLSLILFP